MANFLLNVLTTISKQNTAFHTHQNGKNEKDLYYQVLSRNNRLSMEQLLVGV